MSENLPFTKKDFLKTNPGIKSNSNIRDGLYEIKEAEYRPITAAEAALARPPKSNKRSQDIPKSTMRTRILISNAIMLSKEALTRLPKNQSTRKKTCSPMTRPATMNPSNLPPKSSNRAISLPKKAEEDYFHQSLSNYLIIRIIGKGAYATVRLATCLKTNQKVAIKTYDKYQFLDPIKKTNLNREIEILKKLNHPNIVKLFDTIDGKKHFHLIMEYIKGNSLYSYLKTKPNNALDEAEAKRIFKQIISALDYCHSHSVAHRDIKLDNVLLDKKNNVKLIDFGFSTLNSYDEKSRVFCGTPSYMAPEIVGRKDYYGANADVWALGILLYAMVCGKMPFKAHNDKELYRRIERGSFSFPPHFGESLKGIINRMLEVNPNKRPNIRAVLGEDWISSNGILRSTTFTMPIRQNESGSLDLEIISGIKKLGFTEEQILKDIQNEKSEIFVLYNKMKRRGRDSIERVLYMKDLY